MQKMLIEVQYCQKIISTKFKKPLQMTDEDEKEFKTAEECHIKTSQVTRAKAKKLANIAIYC